MNLLGALMNDMFAALIGYLGAHFICCDYIYKHRGYVIERLVFERNQNIQRDTFDLAAHHPNNENVPLDEYPWAQFVT